jgi:Family of unknown function (DUF5908)
MAIHVKELVIKANVGHSTTKGEAGIPHDGSALQSETIKLAVAEAMRVLKDKKFR